MLTSFVVLFTLSFLIAVSFLCIHPRSHSNVILMRKVGMLTITTSEVLFRKEIDRVKKEPRRSEPGDNPKREDRPGKQKSRVEESGLWDPSTLTCHAVVGEQCPL
ncbi:hypothetical protein COCSADRAFT_289619 [Bipolaris sorokiniana ND90Pr]|uniref:Uncharacterized protein n=1 Tax=Cochliobolus sativus (strain ND90Pr / ATCC 201652) TaxID=665912 RepID=M2TE10_COCSN|nr:uncharacterized protein COCSADRAFT_289619 [Bipolaris sorokiniana ND90Pr]EMD67476.1 hypothetical protein COCSADRAFT_289619 [Bipolaris sorokiniana ND90Pr]